MVKRKGIYLLVCALVLGSACGGLSACGGELAGRNDDSTEVVSKEAVSEEAVFGSGASGDRKRSKMYAKTSEDLSVSFKIQEKTEQGYRARVKISPEEEGLWDWELYLELEDEITEITGAEIVSHEENRYIIRGTEGNRDIKIYEKVYFDVSVSCQGQIHEPEVCYLTRQEDYMGKKDYECRAADVERTGDSVKGVDLFFVFEEKNKDSYRATAELTNVMEDPVADWEICLECEDEIKEISGAEILSHEGNMYRIRAKDRKKWIPPYGMVTFQVKVSCSGKIHPLGKVYLAKARFQDEETKTEDGRKEIHIREKDLKEAAGPCWLPYNILYEKDQSAKNKYWERSYDLDDFETYEEYKAYVDRNEWGKKMGR